jgi:hypothetical protein
MGEVAIELCRFGLYDLFPMQYVEDMTLECMLLSSITRLIGHAFVRHESGIMFLTNISEFEYINKFFYIIINSSTASLI